MGQFDDNMDGSTGFPGDESRTDEITYAGALDHSFQPYADVLAYAPSHAIVQPLLYHNRPEGTGDITPDLDADGQYYGTIGAFHSSGSIVQSSGPWYPDYPGTTPIELQPHLANTEPWLMPDGQ